MGRDFFNTSKYTYQTDFIYQDYAGVGVNLYGYTQQFGNGIAATVSVQDPTPFEHPIVDLTAGGVAGSFGGFVGAAGSPFVLGGAPTNDAWQNGGFIVPDIVFNVRRDQAWGGAQAAAILHDNRARYYNNTLAATGTAAGASHPSDKWGWAVSGGLELNLPWAKGDSFAVQSQYCVGDSESCDNFGTRLQDLAWSLVNNNKIGLGWQNDAFFANTAATGATGLQLTTMWNIFAAIQHYWVPDVRTSRCTAAMCSTRPTAQTWIRRSAPRYLREWLRRLGSLADRLAHHLESGAQSRCRCRSALHRLEQIGLRRRQRGLHTVQ